MDKTAIEINDMLEHVADWAVETDQFETVLFALRKKMLEHLLQLEGQNQCAAARRIHVHRNNFSRWLQKHGIVLRRKPNGSPYRKKRKAA